MQHLFRRAELNNLYFWCKESEMLRLVKVLRVASN